MNNNRKYIFGLGSGRCGTTSLSKILSYQKDTKVTHELFNGKKYKTINWNFTEKDLKDIKHHILKLNNVFSGTVAFYLLNYIDKLIDFFGENNCKIIIIQRTKNDTVQSYINWTSRNALFNHWSSSNFKDSHYTDNEWDVCYPKYDIRDKRLAIEKYYDDYYSKCSLIKNQYSNIVKHIYTDQLNEDNIIVDLLRWIGYDDPKIPNNRKFNAG